MGAESLRAVSGSHIIHFSCVLGAKIAPKLSAPSRFPGIYSANLFCSHCLFLAQLLLNTSSGLDLPRLGSLSGLGWFYVTIR
jgi:hypothetical protein